ncbi:hypothetical protein Neosp_014180 [[Neocosmospora] mangrovei]
MSNQDEPSVNVIHDIKSYAPFIRAGPGEYSDILNSKSTSQSPIVVGFWRVDNFTGGTEAFEAEYDEVKYILSASELTATSGESTWKDGRSGRVFQANAGSAVWLPKGSQTILMSSKDLKVLYVEQTYRQVIPLPIFDPAWSRRLDHLYDRTLNDYCVRNKASQDRFSRALEHMPGGNTRSVLHYDPFPMALVSGRDCFVTSADGVEYVDFVSEFSAAFFGHSNPTIMEAIKQSMSQGMNLGGPGEAEIELARHIKSRFRSIEKLRFCNSGSEANTMALALATAVTKRRKIVAFQNGYHGGFISFGNAPSTTTIPHEFLLGRFNDIEHAKTLISDEVAAIIVEPVQAAGGCVVGTADFLRYLREAATKCGAILIFDEVVTSRLHINGLQGKYGIYPDMTTIGKYVGGGLSFGAFGGRADIMDALDPRTGFIAHSGTYNNNVFSMAAGVAAAKLLTQESIERANSLGDSLRNGINSYQKDFIQASGIGSMIGLHFLGPAAAKLRDALFFYMLGKQVYIGKRGFLSLSLAHEPEHIQRFLDEFAGFIDQVFGDGNPVDGPRI